MSLPDPARLEAALAATRPAAATRRLGPFLRRDRAGGGRRVSAATAVGNPGQAAMGAAPLFRLRPGQGGPDARIADRGLRRVDPTLLLAVPAARPAAPPLPRTVIPAEAPLAVMAGLWAEGGTGPEQLAVMARVAARRTFLPARENDRPAGAAVCAVAGDIAMPHALQVAPRCRRRGVAARLLRWAALWAAVLGAGVLLPAAARAAITLPAGAERTGERQSPWADIDLPAGPWRPEGTATRRAEGTLSLSAWRMPLPEGGTLALIAPLRDQLRAGGFAIVYDCAARACGGFDFRFLLELLPEPAMHVDLGDFRYLLAERGPPDGPQTLVAVVASRSRSQGHVQITEVAAAPPVTADAARPPPGPAPGPTPPPDSLGALLEAEGRVALDDLTFESGATRLGPGPFPSLVALAAYLAADPARRVVLVGHSDATGSLAANVALSRQRAQAVVERLATAHGVSRAQIAAEGVGFLAPRATNLTEAGRTLNRRVEAVLASTR